ncbi:MAG: sigma-54-dependent Fis family transcriptional regulator [Desulfuromonadales bacterium C00003094]|nr:MAG: sigma-54-dependent Fis family transcriptional regulator [Desulfuromonadales bacterium C00003094]
MQDSPRTILLVSDDSSNQEDLAVLLRDRNDCLVLEAKTPEKALEIALNEEISILLTDLFLPQKKGIELLKKIQHANPQVVVLAGVPADDRNAQIAALKAGAFFCINTPYNPEEAVIATSRALSHYELLTDGEPQGRKIRKTEGFHGIIGNSAKMQQMFKCIEQIAKEGMASVLILGESGTGKELVARAVHAHGPRRGKNFVPVNCAAIPEDLLESELFGYIKGAFTGATQSKMGRIQYSNGGTLFLDEIGDMKPSLQAKLLRVIQEKEYEPVGGIKPVPVDVRIVAATHRNLEQAVEDGLFREDLYYRLNVVPITIPPLRERKEDVPLLIERFIAIANRNKKQGLKGFSPIAIEALLSYPWPGNVRELENLVQRMAIFFAGKNVGLKDLPEKYQQGREEGPQDDVIDFADEQVTFNSEGIDFNSTVSRFENKLINHALTLTGGNKREAAKLLNLKRTTLIEKIKRKKEEDGSLSELLF